MSDENKDFIIRDDWTDHIDTDTFDSDTADALERAVVAKNNRRDKLKKIGKSGGKSSIKHSLDFCVGDLASSV